MDEMAKIQKLARQALKTFRVNGPPVKENLDVLKAMVRKSRFYSYKRITLLSEQELPL